MASAYMTAAQVGSYFVTQYYQMLQQSPEFVHQLYSDVGTMIRIDGQSRDTDCGMMGWKYETNCSRLLSPVPNYLMGGAVPTVEYITAADRKENGTVDQYSLPEQRLQKVQEPERILEDTSLEHANGYLEHAQDAAQEVPPSPAEEPQKHTYASILRVAKGQSGSSAASAPSSTKNMVSASEWHQPHQDHQSHNQQSQQSTASSAANESFAVETSEEVLGADDRGEIKSVYARGLPLTLPASEIEEEFKQFGEVGPADVAIRRVKDTDVCYAFVEFEDITSAQNAIQAATVQVSGHQVYIEERRANSSFARGRRGRGRGGYQPEPSSRGRFRSRSFGQGGNQVNGDYNRSRGNGFQRQTRNQGSRNGHPQTEVAA